MRRKYEYLFACIASLAFTGDAAPAQAAGYEIIHSFRGGKLGGHGPNGLLYVGNSLYGTTALGGKTACSLGCGTVFVLNLMTLAAKTLYFLREARLTA